MIVTGTQSASTDAAGGSPAHGRKRRRGGFVHGASLIRPEIRKVLEKHGFSEPSLLTRWAEIVGPDLARMARPVRIRHGGRGMGATLVLLTTGAQAPILQTQLPRIRERVNAVYGYAAISRIHLTQTSGSDFPVAGALPDSAATTPQATTGIAAGLAEDGPRYDPAPASDRASDTASPPSPPPSPAPTSPQGDAHPPGRPGAPLAQALAGIRNPALRKALDRLGRNILAREKITTHRQERPDR